MSAKVEAGYPDFSDYPLLGPKNLFNLTLFLFAALPSVAFCVWLFRYFEPGLIPSDPGLGAALDSVDDAAAFLLHHPLVTVNLLFFANVCVGFWLVSLIQRSAWLIDPYWTVLPPLMALFYWSHPLASHASWRGPVALTLLGVWALRLTYNYLRREHWRFGFREDWRFVKRRAESRHFWWYQFFYVYVAQQFMLVGLSLPFWAIAFHDTTLGAIDGLFVITAASGLIIAHLADTDLARFMRANKARVAEGQAKLPLLDRGLWRYSRHPNYFGEQVFWWSVAGLGALTGEVWVMAGAALNSCVFAYTTYLTEKRMLDEPTKREVYEDYISRTSVWIPRPPRGS